MDRDEQHAHTEAGQEDEQEAGGREAAKTASKGSHTAGSGRDSHSREVSVVEVGGVVTYVFGRLPTGVCTSNVGEYTPSVFRTLKSRQWWTK